MNIGQAAAVTGVSAKRIRYYEQIGLLETTRRTGSGYRYFTEPELHELRFIERARRLGFSVSAISGLLELWRDKQRSSADVKRLATRHIEELEQRIAELRSMADTLKDLAKRCRGNSRPDCPILGELGKARS